LQNSPNPFVQRTNITFGTPKDGNVQIKLYNMQGQLIRTLLDRKMTAGEHTLILNATELGMQGVYYYTMQSGNFYDSKKIVIVNIEE
jgi:5-hydroxyisourate hydrolase-like protein (transthyretin family)